MREIVNKLEDQSNNIDELRKTRNDLKDKTNDLMKDLDD